MGLRGPIFKAQWVSPLLYIWSPEGLIPHRRTSFTQARIKLTKLNIKRFLVEIKLTTDKYRRKLDGGIQFSISTTPILFCEIMDVLTKRFAYMRFRMLQIKGKSRAWRWKRLDVDMLVVTVTGSRNISDVWFMNLESWFRIILILRVFFVREKYYRKL